MNQSFPIRPEHDEESLNEIAHLLPEDDFDKQLISGMNQALEESQWSNVFKTPNDFYNMDVISHVPMKCKGEQCRYADMCPILRAIRKNPNTEAVHMAQIVNKPCRVDLIQSSRLFIKLALELALKPEETFDTLTVVSIVHSFIMWRRLDWEVQIEGYYMAQTGAIHQPSGQVFYNKVINPLIREIDNIQKRIGILGKQLNASRADKLKAMTNLASVSEAIKALSHGAKKVDVKGPRIINMQEGEESK